jgi:hypothetical protein
MLRDVPFDPTSARTPLQPSVSYTTDFYYIVIAERDKRHSRFFGPHDYAKLEELISCFYHFLSTVLYFGLRPGNQQRSTMRPIPDRGDWAESYSR